VAGILNSWTFAEQTHDLRIYHGDALELLPMLKPALADAIIADPPYFLSNGGVTCHAGKMVSVNKGAWDQTITPEQMHRFNLNWLRECRRVLKPNGTIWISGTLHNIHSVGYALQTLGYKILNDIAWFKVNPPPNLSCRYFTHATETILWARRDPKARHVFNYREMKAENGGKQMQSLWHIKPPARLEKRYGKHPTQKPEALLERIIRASTNTGDIVLDPFCGSGTTGVACARLGRRFVGFDRAFDYLQLAVNRLHDELKSLPKQWSFAAMSLQTIWLDTGTTSETWVEIVFAALIEIGGEGHLNDINRTVQSNPRTAKTRTWTSTVRRVVRQSIRFEPLGRGRYRLKSQSSEAQT